MLNNDFLFDSRDVAAYIAQKCVENRYYFNNTKIQKLLYCCYGAVLAKHGIRLCDESPRAWQYGPVFPKVFRLISKNSDISVYSFTCAEQLEHSPEIKSTIDAVISYFGQFSATGLSEWSHRQGSPWDKVVNDIGEMNDRIPDDLIKTFFAEKVYKHNPQQQVAVNE